MGRPCGVAVATLTWSPSTLSRGGLRFLSPAAIQLCIACVASASALMAYLILLLDFVARSTRRFPKGLARRPL